METRDGLFSHWNNSRDPLNTIFTESVMARYLKIFNFIWNLKHVEHALGATWKTMSFSWLSRVFNFFPCLFFCRVGINFPKIEVFFDHSLNVDENVYVGRRSLPSIPNFSFNMLDVCLTKLMSFEFFLMA